MTLQCRASFRSTLVFPINGWHACSKHRTELRTSLRLFNIKRCILLASHNGSKFLYTPLSHYQNDLCTREDCYCIVTSSLIAWHVGGHGAAHGISCVVYSDRRHQQLLLWWVPWEVLAQTSALDKQYQVFDGVSKMNSCLMKLALEENLREKKKKESKQQLVQKMRFKRDLDKLYQLH
jgi:hypothetical protein